MAAQDVRKEGSLF